MSYYRQGPFRPGGGGQSIGVPPVTPYLKWIMMACGGVWLLQITFRFALHTDALEQWLGVLPQKVIFGGRLWQPVTYMFLHSPTEMFHLLLNMLFLWMFGSELERHWGSRAFLRYYMICGISGGVCATLLGLVSGPTQVTIGASGAIFGLLAAYGIVFAERTILFMMIFPMKARTMAMIMFGIAFFYTLTQPGSGVSHIAHLGGGIGGVLYLKRVWRIGSLVREWRWKRQRKKFSVLSDKDEDYDRWLN